MKDAKVHKHLHAPLPLGVINKHAEHHHSHDHEAPPGEWELLLPHAPGGKAERTGKLSEMWYGPGPGKRRSKQ